MDQSKVGFQKRLRVINRRHKGFVQDGYQARLRGDGLIELVPRRTTRSWISARAVVFVIAAIFSVKGCLIAFLGSESYDLRVQDLSEGVFVERMGATIMSGEPVSRWIAEKITPYIR